MSRVEAARRNRGITQEEMARAVGLSTATYRRLESLQIVNPPLRYLVNCAYVLNVQLADLLEDEWLEWTRMRARDPAAPPDPPRGNLPADRPLWPPH